MHTRGLCYVFPIQYVHDEKKINKKKRRITIFASTLLLLLHSLIKKTTLLHRHSYKHRKPVVVVGWIGIDIEN